MDTCLWRPAIQLVAYASPAKQSEPMPVLQPYLGVPVEGE